MFFRNVRIGFQVSLFCFLSLSVSASLARADFNPEGVWSIPPLTTASVSSTYSTSPTSVGPATAPAFGSTGIGNSSFASLSSFNLGYQPASGQIAVWLTPGIPPSATLDASHNGTVVLYKGGIRTHSSATGQSYWCIENETLSMTLSFSADASSASITVVDKYDFHTGPSPNCMDYLSSIYSALSTQQTINDDNLPWTNYYQAGGLALLNLTHLTSVTVTYSAQISRSSAIAQLPGHCDATSSTLTHLPVDASSIVPFNSAAKYSSGISPLGSLNPILSSHVFPNTHPGISLTDQQTDAGIHIPIEHPLYAASLGKITHITANYTQLNNNTHPIQYTIDLIPCQELGIRYGHVISLSNALQNYLASNFGYAESHCPICNGSSSCLSTPCLDVNTNFDVASGDTIGTVHRDTAGNILGFDFQANDSRFPLFYINPNNRSYEEQTVACPFDYYPSNFRDIFYSFLPPTNPTCGTIDYDRDNTTTAQGYWYNYAWPGLPDQSPHMALVPDNVDPSQLAFSIGSNVPGFSSETDPFRFLPHTVADQVNQPFQSLSTSTLNQVYCYQFEPANTYKVIFVQFVKPFNQIGLQIAPGTSTSCPSPPFTMPSGAVTLFR